MIDVRIVVAILLIGVLIARVARAWSYVAPANVRKLHLLIVGLIALDMSVAFLLGFPTVAFIH